MSNSNEEVKKGMAAKLAVVTNNAEEEKGPSEESKAISVAPLSSVESVSNIKSPKKVRKSSSRVSFADENSPKVENVDKSSISILRTSQDQSMDVIDESKGREASESASQNEIVAKEKTRNSARKQHLSEQDATEGGASARKNKELGDDLKKDGETSVDISSHSIQSSTPLDKEDNRLNDRYVTYKVH